MYRVALLRRWQSKRLDDRPCSATWQRPIMWRRASRAGPLTVVAWRRQLALSFREQRLASVRLITRFIYGICRMTAWPVITDKWVSYNNDVTHFSRKQRSPTSFPHCSFYHGSVTHQRSRRRHRPPFPLRGEWPALTSVTHHDDAVNGGPWTIFV